MLELSDDFASTLWRFREAHLVQERWITSRMVSALLQRGQVVRMD